MLSEKAGRCLDTYVSEYVVFDLETTGISCYSDRVVEISAIRVREGKAVGEFSTLVNPGRPIPYSASSVNGITDDMVADCPPFQQVLADFLRFAGDEVLVGHNIRSFDMKFLYRDAESFWGKTIGNDYIDTLPFARACLPQLSRYRLTDLAEYYRISVEGAHRALNDCRMNQMVFERLAKEKRNPEEAKALARCPKCGNILRRRSGKYGAFWGCAGYPACKYTRP